MKKILFTAILFSLISYSCDDEDSVDQPSGNGTLSEKIVLINIEGGTFTMGGVTIQGDAPKVTVSLTEFQISESDHDNYRFHRVDSCGGGALGIFSRLLWWLL